MLTAAHLHCAHVGAGRITLNFASGRSDRALTRLAEALERRILVIDGAMGTMLQRHRLDEAEYRGDRFGDHDRPLDGNHDLLTLTRPTSSLDIHRAYLAAGADIIETNTFSGDAHRAGRLRPRGDLRGDESRRGRARASARTSTRRMNAPRFVAGVLGPTNRTASLSPDVNDPGVRNVTFAALVAAYEEAMRALLAGGST